MKIIFLLFNDILEAKLTSFQFFSLVNFVLYNMINRKSADFCSFLLIFAAVKNVKRVIERQ